MIVTQPGSTIKRPVVDLFFPFGTIERSANNLLAPGIQDCFLQIDSCYST